MGFETFRVELHGESARMDEVNDVVRKFPNAEVDLNSIVLPGSNYYLVNDGRHLIEIEVAGSPVRVSCRFTLCHPLSIDEAFLDVLRALMTQLRMPARICDDVRPEHARLYSLDEFAEFADVTSRYVAIRRAEWLAAFGYRQMAATTSEVYQRIILPQCAPVVKQPT